MASRNTKKENFSRAVYFCRLLQSYTSAKDELSTAEMMNNQSVALLHGKAEGIKGYRGTEEIFQKLVISSARNCGQQSRAALEGLKQWKEALAEYDRAASLLNKLARRYAFHCAQSRGNLNLKRGIADSQMDVYDSLRLVENPPDSAYS
jgi:hypothetical protein